MSQDDIISYIVTGRPASDNPLVGSAGWRGVNASQVAIGQLAGTLGGAAGEELGFDVFTIRQEPEQGLTLTAGRYLGSRVFASLHQPLRIGSQHLEPADHRGQRTRVRAGVRLAALAAQHDARAAACRPAC